MVATLSTGLAFKTPFSIADNNPGGGAPTHVDAHLDAGPIDSYSVRSPFAMSTPVSSGVTASVPSTAASLAEAPTPTRTGNLVQRVALAGLGGLALLGSIGLTGCSAPAPAPPTASQSQSVGAVSTQAAAADPTQASATDTTAAAASDNGGTVAYQQQTPGAAQAQQHHARILGQDVSSEEAPAGVQWTTYSGTHSGVGFTVEYPKGWKVTQLYNGIAVLNPAKPEEFVAFQFRQDSGNISPQGLLNKVLQESQVDNVQINRQTPIPTRPTPNGAIYGVETDVSYSSDGVPVRGVYTTAVTNSNNGTFPFYIGSVVATQTTQADFQHDAPILHHVSQSMAAS